MKKIPTLFLQAVVVFIGIAALAALVLLPLTEGRAAHLDLVSIYTDPFILYAYVASIAFFVALYNSFKLLGYIRQNKIFSTNSLKTLKNIRYCAILFGILIVAAGVYIKLWHDKDDDPAGFLSICFVATLVVVVVIAAVVVFERILKKAIEIKSENDLTV